MLPNFIRYFFFSVQKFIVTKIRYDPQDLKIVTGECDIAKYKGDLGSYVRTK